MNEYLAKYKALNLPGKLLAINVTVWLALQIGRIISWLFTANDLDWQTWLALHADWQHFLVTPWTLLTYFFVHANFGDNVFHLLFNMLWLWWFGQYFLRTHTGRQLLGVYLQGGLVAGLLFLAAYNFFPTLRAMHGTSVVGASSAIFALVAAVAMRHPEEALYLNFFVRVVPLKMKWFALIALAINIMNLANGQNVGGIVCHLGGMLYGVLYGYEERRGIDLTRWFNRMADALADIFKPRPKMRATRGGRIHVPNDRAADHDYNQRQHAQQQRIDAILDKISKGGYDALSAEEKAMLFDASQRRKK